MHILSAKQFTLQDIQEIVDNAVTAKHHPNHLCYYENGHRFPGRPLRYKTIATLFYEPSTRTRLSFEAAMYKLGGNVISTENAAHFSSAIKGETLEDTIRVVSSYVDAIVLRHSEVGAAERAAKVSAVPIINAGDGYEHPTQALLDIYTIDHERRNFGEKDVNASGHYALVGDLRYGRTIHSLIYLLGLFRDVRLTLVSPEVFRLPEDVLNFIKENGIPCTETTSLEEALEGKPDVVYMTRIQKERIPSNVRLGDVGLICFTKQHLDMLKEDAIIMHPLPRVNEIATEVDNDRRAVYFRQAENGLWLRAGLLYGVLGNASAAV